MKRFLSIKSIPSNYFFSRTMSTSISFGQPKDIKTTVVIASKGQFDRIADKLPVKINHAPFKLENPPKFVSIFENDTQTILAEYENKLSRCLGSVRNDLVRKIANTHVPENGNATVLVACMNKEEAYTTGLAIARNWHPYNKKSKKAAPRTVFIQFYVENGDQVDLNELQVVANGIKQTQRLMDTPCSELRVSDFVKEAQALKERIPGIGIQVISGKALDEQKFGGIYGVGKGASDPPALVILSHLPIGAKKTIALVGKGIVYDTGGLSLKPTNSMCGMKHDMGGAAGVFSAFEVIAKQNVNKNVYALLCLAENAIGPDAMRNDDILYMHSGKTVEINNTDAEGRLVLGDGVSYASKVLNPDVILDMATLTGAQMICTGLYHAGFITPSDKLEKEFVVLGKKSGDLVFPMVYCPELFLSQFDSKV